MQFSFSVFLRCLLQKRLHETHNTATSVSIVGFINLTEFVKETELVWCERAKQFQSEIM